MIVIIISTNYNGGSTVSTTTIKRVPKEVNRKQVIALRIGDARLQDKIERLSKEQHVSLNMAVNMLLGFAFNEVEKQNKRFIPKIVFESK
jgi:hypothetical protein